MSSSLLSFLPTAAIQERIPEKVMPKPVSSASVVTGRNKTRYTPISGQTYASNGNTIITWRITDTQAFLDLASAFVHFRLAAPLGGDSVPDDLISSLFQRCRVSVNGVLVEDSTDINVKSIVDMYSTGTRDFYRSAHGEFAGAWKWDTEGYGGGAITSADVDARAGAYATQIGAGAQTGADTTGVSFYCPLGWLTGLARMGQYFPLRLMGNLEIVLFLEQGTTALYSPAGAGGQTYSLSDVTLEVDTLTLAPVVVSAYDKLASADSSEGGVVMPVDVNTTNRINYSGGTGVKTLQVSRGTTQLLSLAVVKRDSNDLTAIAKPKLSTFLPFGAVSYQTQIGAVLFPSFKDDSFARMWTTTAKCWGKLANQFSAGLVSRQKYSDDTPGADANTVHKLNQHIYAISYEQEAYENVDLQGISTLASGSVIQVNIEDSPTASGCAGSPVANVFIRSRRYIQLANQSVQVIGN